MAKKAVFHLSPSQIWGWMHSFGQVWWKHKLESPSFFPQWKIPCHGQQRVWISPLLRASCMYSFIVAVDGQGWMCEYRRVAPGNRFIEQSQGLCEEWQWHWLTWDLNQTVIPWAYSSALVLLGSLWTLKAIVVSVGSYRLFTFYQQYKCIVLYENCAYTRFYTTNVI